MAETRAELDKEIAAEREKSRQYNLKHWKQHLFGGLGFILFGTYVINGGGLGPLIRLTGVVIFIIGAVNGIKYNRLKKKSKS